MKNKNTKQKPKYQSQLRALDNLSLGISIVVAVAIGFGIGYVLKTWTGYTWTLWLGLFWGLAAAVSNIYKAYKRAKKEYKELENDPRYIHRAKYGDSATVNDDK